MGAALGRSEPTRGVEDIKPGRRDHGHPAEGAVAEMFGFASAIRSRRKAAALVDGEQRFRTGPRQICIRGRADDPHAEGPARRSRTTKAYYAA